MGTVKWTRTNQVVGDRYQATIGPVRLIAWEAEGGGRYAFRRIWADGSMGRVFGLRPTTNLMAAMRESIATITHGA